MNNLPGQFFHWGLFVSEDTIVDLVNDGDGMAVIRESSWEEASLGGKCR
jgi:hypothetical protein